MDNISKIGLAVCIGGLLALFIYNANKPPEPSPVPTDQKRPSKEISARDIVNSELSDVKETTVKVSKPVPVITPDPEQVFPDSSEAIEVDTDYLKIEFSSYGGVVKKVVLNENPVNGIRKLAGEATGAVTLLDINDPVRATGSLDNPSFPPKIMSYRRTPESIEFTCTYPNDTVLVKTYSFSPDSYLIGLSINIKNNSSDELIWKDENTINLTCGTIYPIEKPSDLLGVDILPQDGKIIRNTSLVNKSPENIRWLGMKTKYFAVIVKPEERASYYEITGLKKNSGGKNVKAVLGCARGQMSSPYEYLTATMGLNRTIKSGEEGVFNFDIYLGPADYKLLKKIGSDFDEILNLGMLAPISKILIWLLDKLYSVLGSYGWSIIFLTIIVKVVIWPLTHKSYKSMGKMQKLQPLMAELKEKYKGDSKKIQAETMKLYKKQGVNPMGGCLPMLFQMPVLFALFTTLRNTILLRKASFWIVPGEWIKDLSGPDALMKLPQSFPVIGDQLNILPLLLGISFIFQQKLTPTTSTSAQAAQQQKMMAYMMPLLFTFMFYSMPSGLNLYFFFSTAITVLQQKMAQK